MQFPLPVATATARLRRLGRAPLFSGRQWLRRTVWWIGAILIGFAAILFADAADLADRLRRTISARDPALMLLLAPAGLALSAWLTRRMFRGAQGSGIPQTIAALHMQHEASVDRVLSLRIALGKTLLMKSIIVDRMLQSRSTLYKRMELECFDQ